MPRDRAILLIDPDPAARARMRAQLDGLGLEVVEADGGEAGLACAAARPFDLVLLDAPLPGDEGLATIARLRALAGDRPMPIGIVAGRDDAATRALAFRGGIDEYVVRPVEAGELRARVAALLARAGERDALGRARLALDALRRAREERAGQLVHDLNSPLTAALVNLDLLDDAARLGPEERREVIEDTRLAALKILRAVRNLLDVARADAAHLVPARAPVALARLFDAVLAPRRVVLRHRRIDVASDAGDVIASIDRDLLGRALEEVVDEGLRRAPDGGALRLHAAAGPAGIEIRIGASGPAFPSARGTRPFEAEGAPGAGLPFARLAVEAHGGRIAVAAEPGLPVVIAIELPRT